MSNKLDVSKKTKKSEAKPSVKGNGLKVTKTKPIPIKPKK